MKVQNYIATHFLLPALLWQFAFYSCQSDARNATRIPPLVNKSRTQWQNDALHSLSDLINRNIDTDVNYFKRAKVYLEKEYYTEALADINEAIDEKDNIGDYFLVRAKIHREMGQTVPALEDAQRAEALQQKGPDLYVLLADIFQENKQFNEAIRYLNQAMRMAPYDAGAYYVRGMLLAHQGDSIASVNNLRTAINLNPRLLRAYVQCSSIYLKLNQTNEAFELNTRAISRFPDNADLYTLQGDLYLTFAKPDTALIYYQKAVSIKPRLTDVIFKMVNINLNQRSYYKALVGLNQIQKLEPQHSQINFLMGFCHEKLGDYPKAREFYATAYAKDPLDTQSRYGLWRVRERVYDSNQIPFEDSRGTQEYKLLDTTHFKIDILPPRYPTKLNVDSTRKAKIE
jgi:tetratricopeptide (TPR) repeat protein